MTPNLFCIWLRDYLEQGNDINKIKSILDDVDTKPEFAILKQNTPPTSNSGSKKHAPLYFH